MIVTLAYMGRSGLRNGGRTNTLTLAPNVARDPVSFDAPLRHPLRFREAISALHDVVVSDLRFKTRDKTAYEAWKKQEHERLASIRRSEYERAREEILAKRDEPLPHDLEARYNRHRKRYWGARQKYANYLLKHDRDLWRLLMPCDPVITVAEDVAFFECFSADESSYGCLTVDRQDGFGPAADERLGTTNVDYSWDLFNQFQSLRSYRETRFNLDPSGFEVATEAAEEYREEKIDLPLGWLRGFMQLQGAMALPMRRVSLSREAVYSLLAWLKRNKARTSPRAIRFELQDGQSPRLVLEPWEKTIVSHSTKYEGPDSEPVRIWGRRRLQVLSRMLPLAERFEVYLLGTGFPSFWVARMGEMRLTVGLSGWTTNDWTRGSALDLLAPPSTPSDALVGRVSSFIKSRGLANLKAIASENAANPADCTVATNRLAQTGQVIFDLDAKAYRWRQIMPQEVGEREKGSENTELTASRELKSRAQLQSSEETSNGMVRHQGKVERYVVEVVLDADGQIKGGKCDCGHHRRGGIRTGPCRHLLALRAAADQFDQGEEKSTQAWYNRLSKWMS